MKTFYCHFLFIAFLVLFANSLLAEESTITVNRNTVPYHTPPQNVTLGPYSNLPTTPIMFAIWKPVQMPNSDHNVIGFQFNLVYGACCNFTGVDMGLVSYKKGSGQGLVMNFVSFVKDTFEGLQLGFYNGAFHVDGVQIGIINYTESMNGIQFGLVNVIENNDIPFFPFVNFFF